MTSPVNTSGKLQQTGGGGNPLTFNAGFTFTAGRDAVLQVLCYDNAVGPIASVTIGGTAATRFAQSDPDAFGTRSESWYAFNIAGGTPNVVVGLTTGGDTYLTGAVTEWASGTFTGVDSGTANKANSTGTSISVATATTTSQANTIAFAQVVLTGAPPVANVTGPTGWTSSFTEPDLANNAAGRGVWHEETSVGTVTAAMTDDVSTEWRVCIGVLKLAGGGGSGAIVGTTSLSLTPSATLRGAGALGGASALSLTPTGTLRGAGAMAGSAAASLAPTGTLRGAAALAGSTALSFTITGALTDPTAGAIAGSAALVLSNNGVLTGAGAMVASTTISFSLTAGITGAAPIAGSTSLSFSHSASLMGLMPLLGASSLSLPPAGALTGAGAMAGSAPISFYLTVEIPPDPSASTGDYITLRRRRRR